MLVTIRLFARLREIAGASELQRELPETATARTAWDALAAEFHALRDYGSSVSVAVKEEYAGFATVLHEGDEVAFLPPVSGGEPTEENTQEKGRKGEHFYGSLLHFSCVFRTCLTN
jgi:molybdopterin converting factor subunit 1